MKPKRLLTQDSPCIADIPLRREILNESIDERCFMGAFWNPNGGIMVSDRRLSKKEMKLLKRKWSENHQLPFNPLKGWWNKIKFAVLAIFG
jgi:hypothetical protein